MAELEAVVAKLGIEGAAGILSVFNEIGESAKKAFEQVSESAEHGGIGFKTFSTGVVSLVGAIAAGTAALAAFVRSNDSAIVRNEALASSLGETVGELEGMKNAFTSVGISSERAGVVMQRSAAAIAAAYAKVRDTIEEASRKDEEAAIKAHALELKRKQDRIALKEAEDRLSGKNSSSPEQQEKLQLAFKERQLAVREDKAAIGKEQEDEQKRSLNDYRKIIDSINGTGDALRNADVSAKAVGQSIIFMAGEGATFNDVMLKLSETFQKFDLQGTKRAAEIVSGAFGAAGGRGGLRAQIAEVASKDPVELKKLIADGEKLEQTFKIDAEAAKEEQKEITGLGAAFEQLSKHEASRASSGLAAFYSDLNRSLRDSGGFLNDMVVGFDRITDKVGGAISAIHEFATSSSEGADVVVGGITAIAGAISAVAISAGGISAAILGWPLLIAAVSLGVLEFAAHWDTVSDKIHEIDALIDGLGAKVGALVRILATIGAGAAVGAAAGGLVAGPGGALVGAAIGASAALSGVVGLPGSKPSAMYDTLRGRSGEVTTETTSHTALDAEHLALANKTDSAANKLDDAVKHVRSGTDESVKSTEEHGSPWRKVAQDQSGWRKGQTGWEKIEPDVGSQMQVWKLHRANDKQSSGEWEKLDRDAGSQAQAWRLHRANDKQSSGEWEKLDRDAGSRAQVWQWHKGADDKQSSVPAPRQSAAETSAAETAAAAHAAAVVSTVFSPSLDRATTHVDTFGEALSNLIDRIKGMLAGGVPTKISASKMPEGGWMGAPPQSLQPDKPPAKPESSPSQESSPPKEEWHGIQDYIDKFRGLRERPTPSSVDVGKDVAPEPAKPTYTDSFLEATRSLINALGGLSAKIGLTSSSPNVPDDNTVGHASGGEIRGPGGVDNVPMWGTAGEWVHPVAAVNYYGNNFMEAVRTMRFPKVNGFALGGMIGPHESALGLAVGGVVPSVGATNLHSTVNSTTNLHIDGRHVARSVVRQAVRERSASGGDRPGWYYGRG